MSGRQDDLAAEMAGLHQSMRLTDAFEGRRLVDVDPEFALLDECDETSERDRIWIGGISRKVLTQTLRRLESHGLVRRRAYAEAPPRVDYELTPLGETLIDPIHVLTEWARANGDAVLDAHERGPGPATEGR